MADNEILRLPPRNNFVGTSEVEYRYHLNVANKFNEVYNGVVKPEFYGAKGDGLTDDGPAIQLAFNAWMSNTVPGDFVFTPGRNYLIETPVTVTFNSTVTGGWDVYGYGSRITSGLTSGYALTFDVGTATVIRHLTIRGLYVYGSGSEDGILKIDGGDSAAAFFYGCTLRDLRFDNFDGNGLYIYGNFFESAITDCHIRAATGNTTGYPIYCYNGTGSGVISSLTIDRCCVSHGLQGIYIKSTTGDAKIQECTALNAQQYGINSENHFGSVILNCHVENNWESAADLANGQAGIFIQNQGTVEGCYGTTNSKQRYVVRAYAAADKYIVIKGGTYSGDVVKYAYVDNIGAGGVCCIDNNHPYHTQGDAPTGTILRQNYGYKNYEIASTSGTGEDTLMSHTVREGVFGVQGGLRVTAFGIKSGSAGNKTLKLHFGSTSITFHAAANNENDWKLEAYIVNYRDDTNQTISWVGYDGTTLLQGRDVATEDTTGGDITLKITGECADGGDTIYQDAFIVEYI